MATWLWQTDQWESWTLYDIYFSACIKTKFMLYICSEVKSVKQIKGSWILRTQIMLKRRKLVNNPTCAILGTPKKTRTTCDQLMFTRVGNLIATYKIFGWEMRLPACQVWILLSFSNMAEGSSRILHVSENVSCFV